MTKFSKVLIGLVGLFLTQTAYASSYSCASYKINYYGHDYPWAGDKAIINLAVNNSSLVDFNTGSGGNSTITAYASALGSPVFNWKYYGDSGTETLSLSMLQGAPTGQLLIYDAGAVLLEYYNCVRTK